MKKKCAPAKKMKSRKDFIVKEDSYSKRKRAPMKSKAYKKKSYSKMSKMDYAPMKSKAYEPERYAKKSKAMKRPAKKSYAKRSYAKSKAMPRMKMAEEKVSYKGMMYGGDSDEEEEDDDYPSFSQVKIKKQVSMLKKLECNKGHRLDFYGKLPHPYFGYYNCD